MEDINPSYYPATRAAGLAGDKINYDRGGPNRFMEVQGVTKARKEIIAGQGNKYNVEFAIKDSVNEQNPIQCTAEVLYPTNKQSAPNVTYKLQSEPQNNTTAKDQEFYNNMKHRSVPLAAEEIPGKERQCSRIPLQNADPPDDYTGNGALVDRSSLGPFRRAKSQQL
ncbi:hypothetical protein GDO81_007544 [Engystomops pustulosus]|uniref:Cystatin LXN-type domain-containing protein n=1 Tax=Engystomops pustulosus TaxID=76066 RepID=A0AAV7C7R5_ENGPU|nr:hypothetical protein GDO81_007544 [Engystomops pustulosus]